MRAVVLNEFGGPNALRIVELSVPGPGPGEVCALNPVDANARSGRMKWGVPPLPVTLGYECSGRVDAVGVSDDPAWVGRRVSVIGAWGGCAEFAIVSASRLVPCPMRWVTRTAPPTARPRSRPGMRCPPSGASQPGWPSSSTRLPVPSGRWPHRSLWRQVPRMSGWSVLPKKVDAARRNGGDYVIDYRAEPTWAALVRALNSGRGGDLIVDGVLGPGAARLVRCRRGCLLPIGPPLSGGSIGWASGQLNRLRGRLRVIARPTPRPVHPAPLSGLRLREGLCCRAHESLSTTEPRNPL